ncbi:MAG: hypothetical protein AABX27_00990, partial [Nanoarchaeota archaeon]
YPIEKLLGKKIIIIKNLQPVVLRGIESNGMLLAASANDKLGLLTVENDIEEGAKVS